MVCLSRWWRRCVRDGDGRFEVLVKFGNHGSMSIGSDGGDVLYRKVVMVTHNLFTSRRLSCIGHISISSDHESL